MRALIILILAALLMSAPAMADDAAVKAGMNAFSATCIYCHDNTPAKINGEGPELTDVFWRKAGSASGFTYTSAMKAAGASGLVWDAKTLDTFLEGPSKLVPGTTMALSIADAKQRAQIIAYLRSLHP